MAQREQADELHQQIEAPHVRPLPLRERATPELSWQTPKEYSCVRLCPVRAALVVDFPKLSYPTQQRKFVLFALLA
jgi:hypothetical protein